MSKSTDDFNRQPMNNSRSRQVSKFPFSFATLTPKCQWAKPISKWLKSLNNIIARENLEGGLQLLVYENWYFRPAASMPVLPAASDSPSFSHRTVLEPAEPVRRLSHFFQTHAERERGSYP
jgi:hypothetical protein